jgi:hypothetical protein
MRKNGLFILILATVLISCKPNADKSMQNLQKINGTWVSADNTIIYYKWVTNQGELSGYSFSLRNNDTLLFNCYRFTKQNDSLMLTVANCNNKVNFERYHQTGGRFNNYIFEAYNNIYPYRISFELINDTLWQYKQENIRGNKVITFQMKKN